MIPESERRQFRCLYRVFLLRIVDLDVLSTRGDVHKLLDQLTAPYEAPGVIASSIEDLIR